MTLFTRFHLSIIKSPSEDISIRNSDIYYINPGEKSFFTHLMKQYAKTVLK